jgi:hypothetical protein
VQYSGYAMSSDSMAGIPYAHVGIKGTNRRGTAGPDGFFSFSAREGDTLYFTSVGYRPSVFIIPYHVPNSKLASIQLLKRDEYNFKTVTIYPWGDKEGFKHAFKNVKIQRGLQDRAEENTNTQLLAAIGEHLPMDGGEATERNMRVNAANYYTYGQVNVIGNNPAYGLINMFANPLAWAQFIKGIKRGDYKKKVAPVAPYKDW